MKTVTEVRQGIVDQTLTREWACDGKARFRSYLHAEARRKVVEALWKKQYETYPCPFCQSWHLTSRKP